MDRKLDIKKGDIVLMKIEDHSNASRYKAPFSEETYDVWVKEVIVVATGRKYITVGDIDTPDRKYGQTKFNVENDYREHYTCGGADYKLYLSKQEILDEYESNDLYDYVKSSFSSWKNNNRYTLEQLRRIKDIIEE